MNKKFLLLTTSVFLFLNVAISYGASFGDMFGGKKKEQAHQAILNQKEQECQGEISQKDEKHQKLSDENADLKNEVQGLRGKNGTLMEAYEKIVSDQGTANDQLKRLRRKTQRCDQISESYEEMNQENQAFIQENEFLEKDKKDVKGVLENLKLHMKTVTQENEDLGVALLSFQEDETIRIKRIEDKVSGEFRTLKRQNASLLRENDTLTNLLKEFEKKSNFLKENNNKLQVKMGVTQRELDLLEKDHSEVKVENKHLAQQASEFPRKFTDLARHNRKLVKETAHMHYNMGVSFIKAKEYKRAAKEFKKVLELKPHDAYANYNLGYIYAEHLVNREVAISHFKDYLTYAKNAKDADWVKKYILTWQTWYGKEKIK